MLAWQGGDTAAFDLLVGRWHARLFGFVLRLTDDRRQAEDAYSDTLLKLVRARHRYQPRQTFRSWLFAVARNAAADARRGRRRWLALVHHAEQRDAGPSHPASPDERLRSVERAEEIDRALAALPEEHRVAVLLRYRNDMDMPEVGEVLGLTERQVRDRLSYARRRLREILGEEES